MLRFLPNPSAAGLTAKSEKIPKTNASEVEALIERFKGSQLKPGAAELIERLLRTVVMPLDLPGRKNLSIKKLKAMTFGPRTERRQAIGVGRQVSDATGAKTALGKAAEGLTWAVQNSTVPY